MRGPLLVIGVVLLLLAGCSRESPPPERAVPRALFRVDLERSGATPTEVSSSMALPVMARLGEADGVEVLGARAAWNAASVFVRAEDAASVEAALTGVDALLPRGTGAPRLSAVDESLTPASAPATYVVEVAQVELERYGLEFGEVVSRLASSELSVEALGQVALADGASAPTLGQVARIERRQVPAEAVVVRVEAATHDVVVERLAALHTALAVPGVTLTQVPGEEETLEVRLRPQAMIDQHQVHFPEVHASLGRFGRARAEVAVGTSRVLLRQVPAPLETAASTVIEGKHSYEVPLGTLADVSVRKAPDAYLRVPGGGFVGYLVVEGRDEEAIAATGVPVSTVRRMSELSAVDVGLMGM